MKKIGIICCAVMLSASVSVRAQGLLDKIDRTLNKTEQVGNQADRAGRTGNRLNNIFGKKKSAAATPAETKTIINLSGVDLATLKSITGRVENTKGVAAAKMKYSASGSTLTLQHSGSTDDLLKALQKTSPDLFAEKNIEALEDGQISVKVKIKSL